jgi:hypothetical protein
MLSNYISLKIIVFKFQDLYIAPTGIACHKLSKTTAATSEIIALVQEKYWLGKLGNFVKEIS